MRRLPRILLNAVAHGLGWIVVCNSSVALLNPGPRQFYLFALEVNWVLGEAIFIGAAAVIVVSGLQVMREVTRGGTEWLLGALRPVRVSGTCPACGYDLRATPGRCPECGAVPAS